MEVVSLVWIWIWSPLSGFGIVHTFLDMDLVSLICFVCFLSYMDLDMIYHVGIFILFGFECGLSCLELDEVTLVWIWSGL